MIVSLLLFDNRKWKISSFSLFFFIKWKIKTSPPFIIRIRGKRTREKLSPFTCGFHMIKEFAGKCLVFLCRIGGIEDGIFSSEQTATPKDIFTLWRIRTIPSKACIIDHKRKTNIVALYLCSWRKNDSFCILEIDTIKSSFCPSKSCHIDPIFPIGTKKCMRHILETQDIITRRIFCKICIRRPVPCLFLDHGAKNIFTVLVLCLSMERKLLFLSLIFFRCELDITNTVLFISEVKTKQAIMTISTIVAKTGISTIFEIKTINTLKTFFRIDDIKTPFASEWKNTVDTFSTINNPVTIAIIFISYTTMTQITVTPKPPIIRILAIFIAYTWIMRNRTSLKETLWLRKKWFIKTYWSRRWLCPSIPFIFIPHRIGTIWTKDRYDFFFCCIACSFMKRPMWPKSS